MASPTITAVPPTQSLDQFAFLYTEGNPSISYLYSEDEQSYRFEDAEMNNFSFIPPLEIKNKEVIFTLFHQKLALYYEHEFIHSLPDFLKKVTLPNNLNRELLDKIAIMANYLSQGTEYEYQKGTAQQQGEKLFFWVKKGDNRLRVSLPSFQNNNDIKYQAIDTKKKSEK